MCVVSVRTQNEGHTTYTPRTSVSDWPVCLLRARPTNGRRAGTRGHAVSRRRRAHHVYTCMYICSDHKHTHTHTHGTYLTTVCWAFIETEPPIRALLAFTQQDASCPYLCRTGTKRQGCPTHKRNNYNIVLVWFIHLAKIYVSALQSQSLYSLKLYNVLKKLQERISCTYFRKNGSFDIINVGDLR